MIGETVSRYRIEAELGSGGMGVVYRARDTQLDRDVALKFLPARLVADPAARARFEREARLASALNHPHICLVHDVDQHEGRPYFVMELCTGETVDALLRHGRLPLVRVMDLARQAADALDAAHRRGIVHRDVKPANLFVSPSGQLKVLDFGLAKANEPPGHEPPAPSTGVADVELTRPGMAIGTAAYMSPEQALGRPVDARSDLFSLGAVLYEMATGERAFAGPTPGVVLDRILNRDPERPRRLDPLIPEELEQLIERLLAKDPAERPASAAQLLAELAAVSRILATRDETPDADVTASRPASGAARRRGRARPWIAVVLALIATAAAGAAWHWLERPPPLSGHDTVLLAGFDNQTGEAVFDTTLSQALAVQLGQSPFLNIVADDRVREALQLMGRHADERLTPALASDVCRRLGTRALVHGSISRIGDVYLLLLDAKACAGGSLAREEGRAAAPEAVLATLGAMASRLRSRIGESLRSVQDFDVPVTQATTPSLEALRAYTLALAERRRGAELEAIPLLEHALELDPGFAAAATTLSTVYGNLGESARSMEYARLAYAQRDRISRRERFFVSYQYEDRVTGDLGRCEDTLSVWKRTFPNDFAPANALAILHNRLGSYERGVEEATEALARTPAHPFAVSNLAHAYRGLGRYEDARREAEQAVARGLATVPTRRLVYQLAILRGDTASAVRQLEWARGTPREFDMVAAEAQVAAWSGQLRLAAERYRASVQLADARRLSETGLAYLAHSALAHVLYGRRAEARALASEALARRGDGWAASDSVPRLRLATTLALLGAPEAARMVEGLRTTMPDSTLVNGVTLPTVRGAIALQRGRPQQAIEELRGAAAYETGGVAALVPVHLRGVACLQAGDGRGALAAFEEILSRRGVDPFSPVCALAPLGAARARRLLGELDAAREAYARFLDGWREADADLPLLLEARSELARLAGTGASDRVR